MYANTHSFTLFGLEAIKTTIEVSISPGLPKFEIIGIPDTTIRESRERIFQSITSLDYDLPPGNITINLAPANFKKTGSAFDLPIALGILCASGQIKPKSPLSTFLIAGELSLKGNISAIKGLFNCCLLAQKWGIKNLICPFENLMEVSNFQEINGYGFTQLSEVVAFLEKEEYNQSSLMIKESEEPFNNLDYSEIQGNEFSKKALQLSILGHLNVLLLGPPGCGKSMLLNRIQTISSPLSKDNVLECTGIHSAKFGQVKHLIRTPPLRKIHHTITEAALIGGGVSPTPGEVSLAHHGFLFLDELSEFNRKILQLLRLPIEEKVSHVQRANYQYSFPCDFIFLAAMNPCPCGYRGDDKKLCTCSPEMIKKYYQKLSGPLLDRIDIILYVDPPKTDSLFKASTTTSQTMRHQMEIGKDYLAKNPLALSPTHLKSLIEENPKIKNIIKNAYDKGFISLRRVNSILKTAKTISILENIEISEDHIYEAMQFCRFKWSDV